MRQSRERGRRRKRTWKSSHTIKVANGTRDSLPHNLKQSQNSPAKSAVPAHLGTREASVRMWDRRAGEPGIGTSNAIILPLLMVRPNKKTKDQVTDRRQIHRLVAGTRCQTAGCAWVEIAN
jgi:hypothetical protein